MEENNTEFTSSDSGVDSGVVTPKCEDDIPASNHNKCSITPGLEERLRSLSQSLNEFSKRIDCVECRFNIWGAKLKEINSVLDKFSSDLTRNKIKQRK